MDNTTFQRIKDLIMQHTAIGVAVKPNPSLDDMAGGLGMFLVLKQMGKQAVISCPTDPVVGISNLVGVDKVQKSLGTGAGGAANGDLTVSFPYKEGEIEKVSYTLENGQLNIVVKAGQNGMSFKENDVKFQRSGGGGAMPTLVFTIGVSSLNDIASIFNKAEAPNTTIVNIDNKPTNEGFGDVVVVSPKFSSVSEQVADFLTLLEPQIELDKDTSQNLFDGINYSTKDFTAPNTSYLAFEMAGILMKKGATRGGKQAAQVPSGQPVSQYFPPIPNSPLQQQAPVAQPMQPVQPVQQPAYQPQPVAQPMQQQPFGNAQGSQPAAPVMSQPIQQAPQQPVQQYSQNAQPAQPAQQPQQQPTEDTQAPPDWLTPKVYKGSTIL